MPASRSILPLTSHLSPVCPFRAETVLRAPPGRHSAGRPRWGCTGPAFERRGLPQPRAQPGPLQGETTRRTARGPQPPQVRFPQGTPAPSPGVGPLVGAASLQILAWSRYNSHVALGGQGWGIALGWGKPMKAQTQVSLVLSGGGLKGLAHTGVFRRLEE